MLTIEERGKLDGAKFAPAFVEQHEVVAFAQGFEDEFALALLLLVGGERLGVFEFGDDFQFKGHVVLDACGVVGNERIEMLVDGAPRNEKVEFHEEGAWRKEGEGCEEN